MPKHTRGDKLENETRPQIALDVHGRITSDYIPEEEVRLELYARLAKTRDRDELTALEDEIVDRFGPPPDETAALITVTEMKVLCHAIGVSRLEAGPRGIAVSFRTEEAKRLAAHG